MLCLTVLQRRAHVVGDGKLVRKTVPQRVGQSVEKDERRVVASRLFGKGGGVDGVNDLDGAEIGSRAGPTGKRLHRPADAQQRRGGSLPRPVSVELDTDDVEPPARQFRELREDQRGVLGRETVLQPGAAEHDPLARGREQRLVPGGQSCRLREPRSTSRGARLALALHDRCCGILLGGV